MAAEVAQGNTVASHDHTQHCSISTYRQFYKSSLYVYIICKCVHVYKCCIFCCKVMNIIVNSHLHSIYQ